MRDELEDAEDAGFAFRRAAVAVEEELVETEAEGVALEVESARGGLEDVRWGWWELWTDFFSRS